MNDIITVSEIKNASVELSKDAIGVRDSLLEKSNPIVEINPENYETATEILRELSQNIKVVEDARIQVKKPVLQLGKKIDGLAKDFSDLLEKEKSRLSKLIGNYIAEEERKAREEAERKAREEAEKLEQMRLEAEKAKHKAEELNDFESAFDANCIEAEISETKKEISESPIIPIPVARVKNTRTITTRKFKITDENLLLKSHPELFSPNETAIRAYVKYQVKDIKTPVPGLYIWEETSTSAY